MAVVMIFFVILWQKYEKKLAFPKKVCIFATSNQIINKIMDDYPAETFSQTGKRT